MGLIYRRKTIIILMIAFVLSALPNVYANSSLQMLKNTVGIRGSSIVHNNRIDLIVLDHDIISFKNPVNKKHLDSIDLFKKMAFSYAQKDEPRLACNYIEKYIKASLDVSFIEDNYFDSIRNSLAYIQLEKKYKKQFSIWWILYLYVGFVGVFVAVVLNFRKRSDRIANFLISAFLLQHSIFIINISLLPTNYEFYFPNSLYLSSVSSFLYGPLLYFYLKKVIFDYKFSSIDLLHLIPTVLVMFLLFPVYNLSVEEKLWIMLNDERPYITFLSDAKSISLIVYMLLIIRMYYRLINKEVVVSKKYFRWYRNIIALYSIYTICYLVYDVFTIRRFIQDLPVHFLIVSIAIIILYTSYNAFVYPSMFGWVNTQKQKNTGISNLGKYRKSGLTKALSLELKGKLLYLLNQEKIYRKNDISLLKLSDLLGTTRHNTSQIINEHFNLNFFELINKYRIEEAKELLKNDNQKKINIIEVAYEVGFNNKVTFNKSFKKYNQITPSEYVKS